MKRTICFLMLSQALVSHGQELSNLGKTFVMKSNYKAIRCDAVGKITDSTLTETLMIRFRVVVVATPKGGYVVSLPPFKDDANNNTYVKRDSNKLYFIINISDFPNVCELAIPRHSFTVGIPTIPVKLRFGNRGTGSNPRYFRFEGNINLGLSAGYKRSFGIEKQYACNILFGFTTASVEVDSVSTKGKVNSTTSASSFSPHLGVVFDVQKVQFGIYTGIDFLYGEPNRHWIYRNQPWVGIGIGYSLLKVGEPNATN